MNRVFLGYRQSAPATPLAWYMAAHYSVRDAFVQLLTAEPRFRCLPIHGSSDLGKSHITCQLLTNALKHTSFACGRSTEKRPPLTTTWGIGRGRLDSRLCA